MADGSIRIQLILDALESVRVEALIRRRVARKLAEEALPQGTLHRLARSVSEKLTFTTDQSRSTGEET